MSRRHQAALLHARQLQDARDQQRLNSPSLNKREKRILRARRAQAAIEFDGANDALSIADPADDGLDPGDGSFLCVAAGRFESGTGGYDVWSGKGGTSSGDNWRLWRRNPNKLAVGWGVDVQFYVESTATVADSTDHVLGWGVDTSSNEVIYVVDTAIERKAIPMHTLDNALAMAVGRDAENNYAAHIVVAEQVFYKRAGAIPDVEIHQLIDYLRTQYGF